MMWISFRSMRAIFCAVFLLSFSESPTFGETAQQREDRQLREIDELNQRHRKEREALYERHTKERNGTLSPPTGAVESDVDQTSEGDEESQGPVVDFSQYDYSFSDYAQSVFVVKGDQGVGSGFFVTVSGNVRAVSNIHVLAGNESFRIMASGNQPGDVGAIMLAHDHDVAVLEVKKPGRGLELHPAIDEEVAVGDDVIVIGNSLGSGVSTQLPGRVKGVGNELIEIDAKFVEGNSGSPIIHLKSGKVIGVASFARIFDVNALSKDSPFTAGVRRFAYRIDSVQKWERANWNDFKQQAKLVEEVDEKTDMLIALAREIAQEGRPPFNYFRGRNDSLSHLVMDLQGYYQAAIPSSDDREAVARFTYWIQHECFSDFRALQPESYYDYFRDELSTQRSHRESLKPFFDRIGRSMR
ncbi:MAG: serine protease [Verrucomicrobiota bacterium]